mgnify:CR=1 FL=1
MPGSLGRFLKWGLPGPPFHFSLAILSKTICNYFKKGLQKFHFCILRSKWNATVHSRVFLKAGCPYLTGKAVWPGFNDLASAFPEIAREWSESRNAESPTEVHKSSSKKYWWKCDVCGHEWRATVLNRTRFGTHCPVCIKEKRWV